MTPLAGLVICFTAALVTALFVASEGAEAPDDFARRLLGLVLVAFPTFWVGYWFALLLVTA